MKIRTKFVGNISLPIILFCISIMGTTIYLHWIASRSIDTILKYENELEMVSKLEIALGRVVMPANDYLIHGDLSEKHVFEELNEEVNKRFEMLEGKYFSKRIMVQESDLLSHLKEQYVLVKALSEKILNLPNPIGNEKGTRLMERMDLLVDDMIENLEPFHERSRSAVLAMVEVIGSYFHKYEIILLSILAAIIVCFFIYKAKIELAGKDWETTFDSVSDLICTIDNGFTITKCNKAFAHKLNNKPENLIGKKCYEVFHGVNKSYRNCLFSKCKETLLPETDEINIPHLGSIFLFSCFPIFDEKGNIKGGVHIAKDITKTRKIEEQLTESYKMASLGRLTAGVVHEILNPLNIISSHVQLLLTETVKGSNAEEDLKSIREEITRIVKITDSLLRFSRKKKLITGEVEINSLLENVMNIVEPEIKLCNIKFIRRFEDGLPKVTANSDELRQVFLNLITNARDAMPEGGTLTVKTRNVLSEEGKDSLPVRLAGKLKGDFIEIAFEDTGSGIPKEKLGSVFDPFFTTKKEGKGTGLGLSISYGIIKDHGGELYVESEVGKGATFITDLPC